MPVERRAVGAVDVPVGLAFVVITIVVVVILVIAVMIPITLTCKLARSVANAPNARASTSVRLVVSYRLTNKCGAFRWAVKFGLCGEISREAHSIDIHRSIRFLLVLMLNVEMQMSYPLSGPGSGTQ
jgi:hypothetical protein